MSKYDELVQKLKEIFQIDKPELDFGVYRILNARAGEINDYLGNRLREKISETLAAADTAHLDQARKDLAEAEKSAAGLGVSPDTVPRVQVLREKVAKYSAGNTDQENAVFSHLLTFFSRYYDNGDFISQRRFKGDTYAIPYAGEEVVLHWANKDQYYTKSGENFSNYAFKLADGRSVHFRLVAADTAKDNRKDNDKERRFVLAEARTVTKLDEEGEEYEEELVPVEEVDGSLILRFEYKAMPKGTKQEELASQAAQTVLANPLVKSKWLDLTQRAPTEKNPQRTVLEKHLGDYTQKNTADYFIHKDLGGFLRRELDFYIKNEVLHLDDVQHAGTFSDIEKNLRMIQCLRGIALDLISFLAQLEDFQKKLWLKKKFVVSAHYCVTLDRIIRDAPELLPEIVNCNAQWEQWGKLGLLEGKADDLFNQGKIGTGDYLQSHPFLMADTSLFDEKFKSVLLKKVEDLDESVDGVLIHGDNFQALSTILNRYHSQINCVYLDPPFNTSDDSFLYKNQYKHSSWLAMIQSRINLVKHAMQEDSVLCCAIDDLEMSFLQGTLDTSLGIENRLGNLVVEIKPSGRTNDNYLATSHEYILFYAKNRDQCGIDFFPLSKEQIDQYKEGEGDESFKWRDFLRTGGTSTPDVRPNSFYPIYFNPKTRVAALVPTEGAIKILPIDSEGKERVWRKTPPSFEKHLQRGEINFKVTKKGDIKVQIIDRIKSGTRPKSVWVGAKYDASSHGTKLLKSMFGESINFSFPKSVNAVFDTLFINCSSNQNALVLDLFSGSGTTGHATISLNREDDGHRKYILVEQGQYFDTITKPRIIKTIFSSDWSDGKPASLSTGISHALKIIRLESYEDTLNNLELRRAQDQQNLLNTLPASVREDYLLRYMLNIESQGSNLSVNAFKKPFDFKLKIAVDSAGAFEERPIDLVETFNYLIGLRVKTLDIQRERGLVLVQGTLPTGEKTLVLWRDMDRVDYETLNKICETLNINPRDSEFEVVYINGDHNIPAVLTTTEAEGGITRTLKLRQIEPEFLSRMFSGEEA